jgi:HAD superfamily hydrolase (TIGR01509 family)
MLVIKIVDERAPRKVPLERTPRFYGARAFQASGYDRTVSSLAAVVFDFDGVVLDSETPEYESHRRVYERCGVALTVEEWCDAIGVWTEGHDERRFVTLCERSPSPPSRDEYHAERRRIFEAIVPREPMRGIRDLLLALQDAGIPAAIASTSTSRWVVPAAERIGVHSLFRAIVTGEEVAHRKPAPDLYLEAARRLGVEPSRAVAIEDSGPGIASAKAAGMTAVAIPHWLTELHDLSRADLRVVHAGELSVERLASLVNARP